ncbi:class I SAM-dependent methyltransferase [Nocardioides sp. ChNu-153]|uniref:class I SAM-dependent methyltransferase n=1 Tax=unclassified Nocardioides TaxID=2615069 RepID=UPI0024075BCA|nr:MULTISPECIES: class I SAM-dependent methyltransferase [unclassified Nocardioides]MDF9715604.1 class I SAM-dependent methyltransferase [Nocardioides sp. ChNu-99]MDN7121276.1 class I SAM-dependent methyltransferase [Nocardioides sp. ChNu-153]
MPRPPHRPGPRRATLRRSVRLLREFRYEQPDPARFYTALAEDSVAQLAEHADLDGAVLLDVGGGPGYFRRAFEGAGATYVALDADVGELAGAGDIHPRTVIGSGMDLPFGDGVVDVCYSSNVLEHVPEPWTMADEMLRVTRPGGVVFLSWTVWWGPWGGHETAPWHYLGGTRARRRYRRTHGHEPKNKYGESLFAVTVAQGLRWAARQEAGEVLAILPRYHPWWARWIVRVPVLREVVTWNLVIVLRKR